MATKYELSEEEKKKAKAYLEQISNQKKEEAQLPTASKSSSNTLPLYSKSNSISLPTAKLATKKESKNIKELNKGDGFKLTDGLYDDRTELQKAKDNVAGVIGNVAMGVESVVPNITKYLNSANKFATKKATSTIANMTLEKITGNKDIANRASGIIGDTVGEKIHNSFNPIAKTNQELNNKDMEEWRNNTIQYNIQRTNNPLSSKLAEMGPSLGNNLLPMAVAAAPVPGARLLSTAMFMTSAGGSYLDDAKQRGMTDDQAFGYATVMGGLEGGTESVISGDMVNKGIKLATGKELSSKLLNSFGLNIAENFLQEAVMEPLSEVTATVTGGKESANWDNIWQRTLTAGIDGALSSVLLAGATIGVGSATNVVNRYNNGERVTQSEIKQALHDVQNSGKINVEEIIEGSIKALNQNNTSNLQQNITNNANNIQEQNRMSQNQTSEQLNDILNNKELPMQSYQYEKSDNVKINNLRQDANKYFNNSEKARNYVSMLEKIITDKDIEIRLDTNLKTTDGRIANGSYSNGVITINPNSTRAGEFIAIHELTHAIGTKSMIDMVENYRKSNAEFDTAVEQLLKNYNTNEINEEALADVSAQLFGNQEFINNIAQNNPNIFQKLYSEIKYLWHQFRGYKNQDQFIEDLYYKWTQAYNSNNKLNNTTNYYIETVADFNEMEYNNSKEIKLPKQEYAILSGIVNSDSNIKPGRNYVETTNATYEVYFKETGEFKVVGKIVDGGYYDTITNGNIQGTGNTRDAESGMQVYSPTVQQSRTGTRNDEISDVNKRRTRISDTSIKNGSSNSNNVKYSIQESENNSDSFNLQKNRFDVSGNENLANSQTLFYRTREDGQYYVQATDGSGKITYDGVFYGEKQLARSLGEEIAKKIVNTSENTNNEIYLQSDNIKSETDYMMAHRPTETGAYASNISKGSGEWDSLMPEDVYEHPEWYFDMNQEYSKESFKVLKQIKNNPNAEITIYRATTGNKINKGDWVTLSKKYAEYHNNSQFKGKGNIIELKVKAKDVQYAGDDINEFGYFPQANTQTTDNPDIRYSQNNQTWQEYLEDNFKDSGTRTYAKDILVKKADNANSYTKTQQEEKASTANKQQAPTAKNNTLETGEYTRQQKNKILNPSEISNLSREDANTTPKLNSKKYERGNKQSNFLSNIVVDSQFLNEDLRKVMSQDENIRYYKGITNEETLEKAYNSLKDGGEKETLNWFSKNDKNTSAEDVAKGWILLKQYQDSGDYQGAVEVAKKMRQMGTSAGQAVQAYNILSRLTPEGMFYYAQSELDEVYNKMVEGKSKQWIEANQDKFNLTQDETQIILDTMKEVSELEDGREKNVKLAQIQKLISDKIPATTGQSVKAWMRISMLFNPKTQVRNVMGNAVVIPVNATSDVFAGALDKLISKKTGIRTTGITKEGIKGYAKGFGKGVFESYDDFRKGINTRNVEGNRFEIGEGKSFKDEGIGKALNRVDNILSFALDVGDRGFYEATFTNSINNQMILNNTTKVTQDMIDIATNEALQRTWQDSNNYTQAVLSIRNILNKANVKGYGLGDVLIPFAKTPANLTKAIVDYSPVGLTKTLALDAKKFTNSLQNGQYSAQLQHNFVQNIGKGLAGTLLYVLAYGLAKAGIATGESDDDKDVKNFMKNSLGISSYSIKIGDKSFTYDWAQPVATPLAIMTNYVKYSKDNPDANAIEKAIKAMDIGTEQLLQQSFMESLNTVLNGNGTTLENLSQAILELPARAIPTFSKQIADMIDSTQRTSFEYDEPVQSAINSVKAKIPGLSQTLPASVDTLGNDIQKYGGNNNLWNVMFNPANTNKGQLSKEGEEIYNVYMQTGDATILPRTAPYYINSNGEKITMTSAQRSNFQKNSGKYVQESLNSLLTNKNYKKLNNDEKANIINEIVSDSYLKAKYDILGLDTKEYSKTRETLKDVSVSTYYSYKINTTGLKKDADKMQVLVNSNYSNKEKIALYENYIKSSEDKKYDIIKTTFTENGLNIDKYLQYKLAESDGKFKANKKDNGTVDGKSISGSAKEKRFNYIENIKGASYSQKVILFALEYKPSRQSDKNIVINYVKNNTKSNKDALEFLKNFAGVTIYKDGTFDY